MRSEVKIGRSVGLRLAHSAERQWWHRHASLRLRIASQSLGPSQEVVASHLTSMREAMIKFAKQSSPGYRYSAMQSKRWNYMSRLEIPNWPTNTPAPCYLNAQAGSFPRQCNQASAKPPSLKTVILTAMPATQAWPLALIECSLADVSREFLCSRQPRSWTATQWANDYCI